MTEQYKYVINPRVKGDYDKEVKRITDKQGEKCLQPTHTDMEGRHRVEQTTSEKFRARLISIGLVKSLDDVKADDIAETKEREAEANEIAKQLKLTQLKVIGEQIKDDNRQDNPNSKFIGEKGGFLYNAFAKWLYKESGHYFIRIRQTGELYYYKGGIYVPHGETYIEEIVQHKMSDDVIISSTHVTEIVRYIKRSVLNEIDIKHIRGERVACKNGVIDLRTKELHKHSPDNYMFKMIPWNYVESATCPNFDGLIDYHLPNDLDKYKFNIMIGYPLINSYIYNKIFFLEGLRGSGKTTFTNILQPLYGLNNTSNIRLHDLIDRPFMRVGLMDSYVNFSPDASDDVIKDASILKTLSGESRLSIDVKNVRESIKLMNCAKLIVDTNDMPEFNLTDDAIFRRIIKIGFTVIVKESDKKADYMDKHLTQDEMEGLLYKAVESAHLILTGNNPFKSTSIAESKEEYENARRNIVDKFIDRHIQIYALGVGEDEYAQQLDVWQAFKLYSDIMGIEPEQRPKPGTFYKSFVIKAGIAMPDNQWIPELKKSMKVYRGIRLVNT